MKTCTVCGKEKPSSEFKRLQCKVCLLIKAREYRAANRDRIRELQKKWVRRNKGKQAAIHARYRETHREEINKRYRKRSFVLWANIEQWISEHGNGCIECGETDRLVLVFHHRNPAVKKYNVTGMASQKWETILKEIEKCDLLCRNCHAKRHFELVDGVRRRKEL